MNFCYFFSTMNLKINFFFWGGGGGGREGGRVSVCFFYKESE